MSKRQARMGGKSVRGMVTGVVSVWWDGGSEEDVCGCSALRVSLERIERRWSVLVSDASVDEGRDFFSDR